MRLPFLDYEVPTEPSVLLPVRGQVALLWGKEGIVTPDQRAELPSF